jgi:hypothetical protein
VLQLYNEETTVCKLYRDIVRDTTNTAAEGATDPGWVTNVPWLYYHNDADDVLEDEDLVEMEVSFSSSEDDKVHDLTYLLAVHKLDGTFEGFAPLED